MVNVAIAEVPHWVRTQISTTGDSVASKVPLGAGCRRRGGRKKKWELPPLLAPSRISLLGSGGPLGLPPSPQSEATRRRKKRATPLRRTDFLAMAVSLTWCDGFWAMERGYASAGGQRCYGSLAGKRRCCGPATADEDTLGVSDRNVG